MSMKEVFHWTGASAFCLEPPIEFHRTPVEKSHPPPNKRYVPLALNAFGAGLTT